MATITMCDRCGAMGIQSAVGTFVFHTDPNARTEKKELCPECVAELVAWANETPVRDNRLAFRDPYREPVKEIESGE